MRYISLHVPHSNTRAYRLVMLSASGSIIYQAVINVWGQMHISSCLFPPPSPKACTRQAYPKADLIIRVHVRTKAPDCWAFLLAWKSDVSTWRDHVASGHCTGFKRRHLSPSELLRVNTLSGLFGREILPWGDENIIFQYTSIPFAFLKIYNYTILTKNFKWKYPFADRSDMEMMQY